MSKFFTIQFCSIFLLYAPLFCSAQSNIIDNKDSLKYYLNMSKFKIDKNADAVILYESGSSVLSNNIMTYKVERIIRIVKQNALSKIGMVAIPAFSNTTIKKVSGVTYNLENGAIASQNIEKADMVKDKITANFSALKFNLPSVKVG